MVAHLKVLRTEKDRGDAEDEEQNAADDGHGALRDLRSQHFAPDHGEAGAEGVAHEPAQHHAERVLGRGQRHGGDL